MGNLFKKTFFLLFFGFFLSTVYAQNPNFTITPNYGSVIEGNATTLTFTLSAANNANTVINIVTSDGTATVSDYAVTTSTITIPAGQTTSTVSIATKGLFPWRLNIKAIYGTGAQESDYLHVVPNLPIILSSHGYHTAHVGKWHLGGMTPRDVKQRLSTAPLCTHTRPGPNQHGFREYIG